MMEYLDNPLTTQNLGESLLYVCVMMEYLDNPLTTQN